jgi:adenine-specific DNA-methyltransferase
MKTSAQNIPKSKNQLQILDVDKKFRPQNRRYLGNKYKLLKFIEEIVDEECGKFTSFCDIFAGTGVVGMHFNSNEKEIVFNDFLASNNVCLSTFFNTNFDYKDEVSRHINDLNNLNSVRSNYVSKHFGGRYFSEKNAKKIGLIREEIHELSLSDQIKNILLCSLLYAADKVANTVGHYDAYRKKMDSNKALELLIPEIKWRKNKNNKVYKADSNQLVSSLSCDVIYIDPPYNSRQYSDTYHILENITDWQKPEVHGIGKKMDRSHIKSDYCLANATEVFADLIGKVDSKHILLSYNSTGDSKVSRSNARIADEDILRILKEKGDVTVYEKEYSEFTTGKSKQGDHSERVFYCKTNK